MKTAKTSAEYIPLEKSAKIDADPIENSASLKKARQTSKTRNFGWLVTGMVEACQQMSADEAINLRRDRTVGRVEV